MEDRIKRLEAVLKNSGINPNGDPVAEKSDAPLDLTDQLSTLLIDEKGTSRFMGNWVLNMFHIRKGNLLKLLLTLGASSGFSLFSPQGLQWISAKTGSDDLSQFIGTLARSGRSESLSEQPDLWSSHSPSEREPLPTKYIADLYIQCMSCNLLSKSH